MTRMFVLAAALAVAAATGKAQSQVTHVDHEKVAAALS